jgi:glyoxylase-like metal-dependent hydrolase (beta-lactamase superfamily II)
MLIKTFNCGPVETNCYLVSSESTKETMVIDAPKGCTPLILEYCQKHGLKVIRIILTHTHWDHIADAAELKKKLGVPLCVGEFDRDNLEHPGSDQLPLFFNIEGVTPDQLLKNGDQIPLSNMTFEVIHTPGHSPGGICLWEKSKKVLFSGDTLFKGTIGRVDFPTSNPQQMKHSLKALGLLPLETRVYPGHGDTTTLLEESWIKNEPILGEEYE